VAGEGGVCLVGSWGEGAGAAAGLFGGLVGRVEVGGGLCTWRVSTLRGEAVVESRTSAARARVNVCFMMGEDWEADVFSMEEARICFELQSVYILLWRSLYTPERDPAFPIFSSTQSILASDIIPVHA
jgi:hypothetical protein